MPDSSTPRYTFKLLRAGTFKLDAGSMFGLIPRSVWSRSVPTDDKGRITVAHNCLLLERVGESPATPAGQPKRVLVEVGTGDKLDPKMQAIFDLEQNPVGHQYAGKPRTIVDCLAEHFLTPESIEAVICSHLHFDHAGAMWLLKKLKVHSIM